MKKNIKPPRFFFNHTALNGKKHRAKRIKLNIQIINTGVFLNGKQNKKLEKNLLAWFGGEGYVTTVASGHDALFLALASLHLKPTDEVIFPVNSYPTAFPISLSGVKLVPVDVDKKGQINIQEAISRITPKTKAFVVVHLYGSTCDIGYLSRILKEKKITLIEDCAQAFGTSFKGKPVGIFGDISCFSFYPTKNLATLGDGGAIWTRHKEIMDYILQAKSYGEKEQYKSNFIAGHSRLPEIQAGILNLYFSTLDREFKKRKKVRDYYLQKFSKRKLSAHVRPLLSHPESDPVPHLFVLEVKKRDRLRKFLKKNSIDTLIHYPYPIHQVPAFSYLQFKKGDFPMAERLSGNILSIPLHQGLTQRAIDYIVSRISAFYKMKKPSKLLEKSARVVKKKRSELVSSSTSV